MTEGPERDDRLEDGLCIVETNSTVQDQKPMFQSTMTATLLCLDV